MKTQFHTLPKAVRADRRKLAFRKLNDNWNKQDIAELVEVHLKTIEQWLRNKQRYIENNYEELKRGNPQDRRLLSNTQQDNVIEAIKTTSPDDHGVAYYLWSRRAICEYIQRKYKIEISLRRISKYTKRWGLSSQRPAKQAVEQDPEKIKTWLEETYPKIKEKAKKEKALILWGDETNLNINTNYQKTYAPKGKTPTLKIPARKTSYSMVSVLANQGKLRYMIYKGGMNAKLFKVFLQRLIKDSDQKIFLILDNLKVHHAKIVQAWQKEHADKIELFFPTPIFPPRES